MKSFANSQWSGYVHTVMNLSGQLYELTDSQLEKLLSDWYGEPTKVSDEEAYGWQGTPEDWGEIIPTPQRIPWWEGRLSLEEDNLDEEGLNSGRQPKVVKTKEAEIRLKKMKV